MLGLAHLRVHRAGIDRTAPTRRHSIVFTFGRRVAAVVVAVMMPVLLVRVQFGLGNQMHAAFRAIAGAGLPDFRVHRAGEDRCGIVLM